MKLRKSSKLFKRLVQLNNHYGRGDVIAVDSEGIVTRRIPTTQRTGFTETRRYRLRNKTVFFLGHQRAI